MKKEKLILKALENLLNESENFWKERKESPAFILGYLQGGIKGVIKDIKQQ